MIPEAKKERMLSQVEKTNSCWIWHGAVGKSGYGQMNIEGRRGYMVGVHRISYMMFRGTIPKGMSVCHSCDNKRCVNPAHLWVGTQSQNGKDMTIKGRGRNQYGPYKAREVYEYVALPKVA